MGGKLARPSIVDRKGTVSESSSEMPPSPGDPHNKPTNINAESASTGISAIDTPDVCSEVIMKMNDYNTDQLSVQQAVLYWKRKADFLNSQGCPVFPAKAEEANFDPTVRAEARSLDEFLDKLINEQSVNDEDLYQKLRVLIAEGQSYESFKRKMKELDYSLKCNSIWENDSVAYRCNTCALTPCMSLCADCFQRNGHEGHDFTRFFSREGGACDCGNADVMKPAGFCCRHGENAVRPPEAGSIKVSLAEYVLMKLLVRFIIRVRGVSKNFSAWKVREEEELSVSPDLPSISRFCEKEMKKNKLLIEFLQECVNYGGPMREAVSRLLLDKQLYAALTERKVDDVLVVDPMSRVIDSALDWRLDNLLEEDKKLLFSDRCLAFFPQTRVAGYTDCTCLLHEVIVYTILYHFPQNVINLCLSMLSETEYLAAYSEQFFKWYPIIANCMRDLCAQQHELQEPRNNVVQNTGSRIIHVSVQMLSSAALSEKLDKVCDLGNVVLQSSLYLLSDCVVNTKLCLDIEHCLARNADSLENLNIDWEVLNLENNAMVSQHGYWFVMGDIQNLMSHYNLAISAIRHPTAFRQVYIRLISIMQGMNLNWRIVSGDHQEHDIGDPVHKSFTLEFETLAITMFNFVTAVCAKDDFMGAVIYFDFVKKALEDWFTAISRGTYKTTDLRKCPTFCVSFHLPLHRHLSTALTHFDFMPTFRSHVEDLRRDEKLLRMLALHPLRIQVARAEYGAGMWVRNGQQLRVQSILYAQPHINTSFHTPDLDMIRYCAANMDREWFICSLFESFHLYDAFRLVELKEKEAPSKESGDMDTTESEEVVADSKPEPASMQKVIRIMNSLEDRALQERLHETIQEFESTSGGGDSFILPKLDRELEGEDDIPVIHFNWLGEEQATVLKRAEWVDALLAAAFRLLSELVVIRLNCGDTYTEAMRTEMVNELSQEPHTYSRLRGSLPEKGSRGAVAVDREFDSVLKEIADFTEPDCTVNGQMKQGTYTLKKEAWFEYFCPVMCHMRALTPRYSSAVLRQVEEIDKERLSAEGRVGVSEPLWIPYRLTDFDEDSRQDSVKDIARVLLADRFIQLAILTISVATKGGGLVRDTTFQLVIYLLTLAVQYAGSLPEDEKAAGLARLLKAYKVEMQLDEGRRKTQTCSAVSLVLHIFLAECSKKYDNKTVIDKFAKVLDGSFAQERIVGGVVEYVGRFLSLITEHDKLSHMVVSLLQHELTLKEKGEKSETTDETKSSSQLQDRKLAAKRRRDALLAANQKKNQKVMQKMMESEGMTQQDLDNIDTSKPDVRLYECPICGDLESPSTLLNPMGLLVRVGENSLDSMSVPLDDVIPPLLDVSATNSGWSRKSKRFWTRTHKELISNVPVPCSSVLDPGLSTDLKTCGHTAHIRCFNSYREAVHTSELRVLEVSLTKRVIGCPLCRFGVNAQLPVKIDWGFLSDSRGHFEDNPELAYDVLIESVISWDIKLPNDVDNSQYGDHYGKYFDGVLEKVSRPRNTSGQSLIVSMIRANVERNITLASLNMPERRKNTRSMVVEHLVPAAVAKTTSGDMELVLYALKDTFMPQVATPPAERKVSTGSGDLPSDFELTLADCGAFSHEELVALRTTSPSEYTSPRKPISMMTLEEMKLELASHNSVAPILLFDHRTLLVRLCCFVMDNKDLSNEDKKQLCRLLVRRLCSLYAIRTSVSLLQRASRHLLVQMALSTQETANTDEESTYHSLLYLVARELAVDSSTFEGMLSQLGADDVSCISVPKMCSTLEECVRQYVQFALVFLREAGFALCSEDPLDDVNTVDLAVIGPNAEAIIPSSVLLSTSIKQYLPVVGWNYKSPSQVLCREPLLWKPATLLELPDTYDALFTRFFKRPCVTCDSVPSNPFVCLLCGQLVCLDDCCQMSSPPSNEVDRHALECGRGVCVYMAVSNALVVLVGKGHAALWGSVYLDAHGEEDRNLRRGKPLFLSEKRIQCLRRDFAEQEWSRAGQWIPLSTLYNQLKDAHFHIQR